MEASLYFAAFKLQRYANEWLTLLRANGGESARLLSQEQCGDAKLRMCCLLVPDRPARVKRLRTLPESEAFEDERPSTWELEEAMDRAGRWGAIYRRIAIVVPVVVKNGIGMAQGMRRLDMTSQRMQGAAWACCCSPTWRTTLACSTSSSRPSARSGAMSKTC